jgi:hypothetical protein
MDRRVLQRGLCVVRTAHFCSDRFPYSGEGRPKSTLQSDVSVATLNKPLTRPTSLLLTPVLMPMFFEENASIRYLHQRLLALDSQTKAIVVR